MHGPDQTGPVRVAVIGGGCAAMSAAFELTRPELEGRYQVTVYQQGWRLGGKGASGRGPFGRIEEHGLHIWMGFYENAFRLMREAYAELGRDPTTSPIATWRDAFLPAPHIGLAQQEADLDWTVWSAYFPPLPGEPGDPLGTDLANPFTVIGYAIRSAEVLAKLFRVGYGPEQRAMAPWWRPDAMSFAQLVERAQELVRTAVGAAMTIFELVERQLGFVRALLSATDRTGVAPVIVQLLEATQATIRQIDRQASAAAPVHRRRASEVFEVVLAAMVGAFRAGVHQHPAGFEVLDEYDFVEWLSSNGASAEAARSPFVHGLYSLMFAYEDGDATRPRVAAGQILRGCIRMFYTYRGAIFYKMSAGMGDIVFAPFYEVLRRRGVSFEFFHRLESIELAATKVSELEFSIQAEVLRDTYEPLVDVGGLPCWPSEPDWSQLRNGDQLRRDDFRFESFWERRVAASTTLRAGEDFDVVVLGVGLGAVPYVCRAIVAQDPRWQQMVARLKTVATEALQVWTGRDLPSLGWHRGPITMTSFVSPYDTWADMTHLVGAEAWPQGQTPGSIGYFCNVLADAELSACYPGEPGFEERARQVVGNHAALFIERDLAKLWPSAITIDGRFDWRVFMSHFTSCNVSPSERYTLSLPGTPQLRISPLDRTYENLTVCGDWTSCGLNLGCVEAAVMSGRLASHAISGSPQLDQIVGYNHP